MKEFLKYITRPSGFGRTQWSFWICMVAVMLYGAALVVIDFDPTTAIVVGSCFALTTGIVVWGTIKNFREDQKGIPRHPNNHYPDICEGCDPVCMKDGRPIGNKHWWYAAVHGLTREEAHKIVYGPRAEEIAAQYTKYINHPKFDDYFS